MADLTDFTTYDTVRAVLGVSDEDLEDTTLALPLYYQHLSLDLDSIASTAKGIYETILLNPTPTPLEEKYKDVMQLFSAYATAKNLLGSLALFAPKSISDGRASLDRFPDPMDDLKEGVETMYAKLRAKLLGLLDEMGTPIGASISRPYFGVSALGYDPVTNI